MSLSEGVKNSLETNGELHTERREYDDAVDQARRSEAYLAEAQRLTKTGSWAWTPGRNEWNYWSHEMFHIFDFDPEQGPPTVEMSRQRIHPEDRDSVHERTQNVMRDKGEYLSDYRILLPDGRIKYVQVIGHAVLNDAGEITELVGTSVDVTEQKRIEDAWRRSEAYLAEGQRLTHTGSWSLDINTRQILHSSAEHSRMFGFDPEKGLPSFEEFLQRVHPEDQKDILETFQALLRSGGDLDLQYRIATPGRPVRYMHAIGHPALNQSGTPREYVGITIDITERKHLDQEREQAQNRLRRSEAYLAEAQELSHTGSFGWDASSGEVYWSPETFRIFGFSVTEKVTVDLILERTHPEDRTAVQQLLQRATEQRTAFDFEHRLLMSDGSVKYVHTVGRPSEDGSGLLEFVGAVTDISEHRLAERVLRRSDRYLTETQRLNRIGSWAFTLPSRKPHYWSDELFRIWGFDPQNGTPDDQTMLQRVHPDDRENVRQYLELLLEARVTGDVEGGHRIILPDGTLKYIHGVVHPVFDDAGHVVEYVGSVLDVTERKRAEEALRRSEAYLSEAQRLNHTGSWAQKPSARKAHYYSEEMLRIWGFDPQDGPPDREEVVQRIHPDDRDRAGEFFELLLEGRITADAAGDFRIVMPDGIVKHLHGVIHPVFDEAGQVVEYIGTDVDVTERKRSEETLRRSEAYLAEAQKLSHTGSWALDPITGKMTYYSEEMFRIMGLEPSLEPPDQEAIWQRVHPEDLAPVIEGIDMLVAASKANRTVSDQTTDSPGFAALASDLRGGRPIDEYELRVVWPDGTLRYIRSYGHPILDKTGRFVEWVGSTIDVTEQKQAEIERERLRQLEADLAHINRISMLGELAASISHELKQPITAGILSARTAIKWLTRDKPDLEQACLSSTNAAKAGERAVEIINRLRSLYMKAPPQRELLDGNEVIREMVALLWSEANRNKISVQTDFAAGDPMIMSDRVQLQQVLMNLMLNAIEAMKATGGSLSLKSQVKETNLFQISVSDTGPGLPEAQEERIFEPFFTTKPQGSGMGLSICRSIIESHGGRLWASVNRECGASFHFTLPTASDPARGRTAGA